MALRTQSRDNDGPGLDYLLPGFVAKGNCPAAKLIVSLHRVDEVTVECVPAHLSIGDHVKARAFLKLDRFIDGLVFNLLEGGVIELTAAPMSTSAMIWCGSNS